MNKCFLLFRFIGLLPLVSTQFTISPINNTLGIYFHEEGSIKISNDKWTLLVYKDILPIREAITNNDRILDSLLDAFTSSDSPRMTSFKPEIQTHVSLLRQISQSINLKYREVNSETRNYAFREKRGVFNGIGTVWKSITGNLDASDGEYFNECINKITRDERHIETLLKNQISVTTSVIKNFNTTIQNLQIDEETFNRDIAEIHQTIMDISDDLSFYQAQIKTLDICESLMESYTFLENTLNDIINAITFARLNILHSSIITPVDLINSLQQISQSLSKNNLPLPIYSSYIPQYIDIIELQAYQSDSKIVFVLKIPLTNPETYMLYRLYPIPILDSRTELHHIIPTSQKYIARDDNSMLYVTLQTLERCKPLNQREKICPELLPYPIDSEAICEAQLLRGSNSLPKTCTVSLLLAKGYNVKELDHNFWLITVSEPLPITINCERKEIKTEIIQMNSLLRMQPYCNAFVGSTRIHGKPIVEKYANVTYRNHPVMIPFNCCQHISSNLHIPDLRPLKLNKIDMEDLNIAQHKLNEYSEELDRLINEPFIYKHLSWFTILTITLIICLPVTYIICKCRRKKLPRITMAAYNDDSPPPPRPTLRKSLRLRLSNVLAKRRPPVHPDQEVEEELEAFQ